MRMKVFLIAGARPNFMKIAPIYAQMQLFPQAFEPIIVHTGQHYDENMSKVFFDELELPRPDINLGVGSGSHAEQTAEIMKRFEPQLLKQRPDMVVVVGDVNSTIACALTAVKSRISSQNLKTFRHRYNRFLQSRDSNSSVSSKHRNHTHSYQAPLIAHVESGERSFDLSMPEEVNRIETDVISDILFTTCKDSDENLLAEGIDPRKIFRVGNIMIDSLVSLLAKAQTSTILKDLNLHDDFILVTLHRPGNVDEPASLRMLLSAIARISQQIRVVFPAHPRTRELLCKFDEHFTKKFDRSRTLIIEPLGYLDFLRLQTQARLVLTDSGGVQVESSYLGVPCLTLRPNTEWQITLRKGMNELVPLNEDQIVQAANNSLEQKRPRPSKIKYWDGKTAERIINVFRDVFQLSFKL